MLFVVTCLLGTVKVSLFAHNLQVLSFSLGYGISTAFMFCEARGIIAYFEHKRKMTNVFYLEYSLSLTTTWKSGLERHFAINQLYGLRQYQVQVTGINSLWDKAAGLSIGSR